MNEPVAEPDQLSRSVNRSGSRSGSQRSRSSSSCHTNYTGHATNVTTVDVRRRRNSLTSKPRSKAKQQRGGAQGSGGVPVTVFLEGIQRNLCNATGI